MCIFSSSFHLCHLSVHSLQIADEQCAGILVELYEIGGGRMAGVRSVEMARLVVGIAPYHRVADGVFGDGGEERLCPPVGRLDALVACRR